MKCYMVTLADPNGQDQRIVVQAPEHDTEADITAYILDPAVRGTKGEAVMHDARVIGIRPLRIKRPIRGTVLPQIDKLPA